jgi:putative transposase
MARHPRLILPGVALHINQRGNNRGACFRENGDYLTYLTHLRHLSGRYGCEVHAYCLMTNHVHLLVTLTEADACAPLMRDLGNCYVRYYNRKYARSGTLWEGRFRSCIVESAAYMLACYRYIELNPLRAGMVAHPGAYPWSSYAANAGIRPDPLVTHNDEYLALAADAAVRQAAYRGLFEQAMEENLLKSIREATNGGYPFASDAFKSALALPRGCRLRRGKPGPRVQAPQAAYNKITALTPN